MSAFKPGDKVRVQKGYERPGVPLGHVFTVADVEHEDHDDYITVVGGWTNGATGGMFEDRFEKVSDATEPEDKDDLYVEPEPLKEGDWCLIWARVHEPSPEDDEIVELRVRVRGGGMATAYTTNDAIVRPADGAVPPWVKSAQNNDVEAIAEVLRSEGDMEHLASLSTAASLYRAGVRITEGGAA